MRFLTTLTLTLCAAFSCITTTNAQEQEKGLQLAPNYYYDVTTLTPKDGKDGDFIIRLTSPGSMTGCYEINKTKIKTVDAGAVIFVTLEEGGVKLNTPTHYDQFGCKMNSGSNFIDIPFNKNTLAENNTNKISIKSKTVGNLFDIKVETHDHSISLHSELKTGARVPNANKRITQWFYPENTIIVFANNMDKNPDIAKQTKNIAASRGLTPLDMQLDGFKSKKGLLFFTDTKNIMKESLNDTDTIVIGQATIKQEYQGANGPYGKSTQHAVFARRPNAHD